MQKGTAKREQDGVDGEKTYQLVRGGGHPSGSYPCNLESLN